MITVKCFVLLQALNIVLCFASGSPYSLFYIANNHMILPFSLSFLPIPVTLFLLYRIKLQVCVSLNSLYSYDCL